MCSFVRFPCNIREAMLHVSENERKEKNEKAIKPRNKMFEQLIIDVNLIPSLAIRVDVEKPIIDQLHCIVRNYTNSKGTRHSAKFILNEYGELNIPQDQLQEYKVDLYGSSFYDEKEDNWHLDREHLAAFNAIKFYHKNIK